MNSGVQISSGRSQRYCLPSPFGVLCSHVHHCRHDRSLSRSRTRHRSPTGHRRSRSLTGRHRSHSSTSRRRSRSPTNRRYSAMARHLQSLTEKCHSHLTQPDSSETRPRRRSPISSNQHTPRESGSPVRPAPPSNDHRRSTVPIESRPGPGELSLHLSECSCSSCTAWCIEHSGSIDNNNGRRIRSGPPTSSLHSPAICRDDRHTTRPQRSSSRAESGRHRKRVRSRSPSPEVEAVVFKDGTSHPPHGNPQASDYEKTIEGLINNAVDRATVKLYTVNPFPTTFVAAEWAQEAWMTICHKARRRFRADDNARIHTAVSSVRFIIHLL